MKLTINNKEYEVLVARTDEEKSIGLQNVEEMESNEGMLFIYDEPQDLEFWMKDTDIPLDLIFINSDWIVKSVKQGKPNTEDIIDETDVQYVLELNVNSEVLPGMEIEISDSMFDMKTDRMYVLDMDGNSQMELKGGERIFSRPNTKTIINMSKRAFFSQKDSDFKKLGKKIFEYLNTQDNREPDYVETKKESD